MAATARTSAKTPVTETLPSHRVYSKLGENLRPRSHAKYTAILDAASRAFITQGFERTSMDVIAEASGVSKRTVYGHFENKHALFVAVIETLCDQVVPPALDDPALVNAPIADVLTMIGRQFLRGIYSAEQIELLRTVITDAARFPELGEVMFNGPVMRSEHVLASYLSRAETSGLIGVSNPALAAAQFMGMLKTNAHIRLLLKPKSKMSAKDIDVVVVSCVDLFLNGVAVRGK